MADTNIFSMIGNAAGAAGEDEQKGGDGANVNPLGCTVQEGLAAVLYKIVHNHLRHDVKDKVDISVSNCASLEERVHVDDLPPQEKEIVHKFVDARKTQLKKKRSYARKIKRYRTQQKAYRSSAIMPEGISTRHMELSVSKRVIPVTLIRRDSYRAEAIPKKMFKSRMVEWIEDSLQKIRPDLVGRPYPGDDLFRSILTRRELAHVVNDIGKELKKLEESDELVKHDETWSIRQRKK